MRAWCVLCAYYVHHFGSWLTNRCEEVPDKLCFDLAMSDFRADKAYFIFVVWRMQERKPLWEIKSQGDERRNFLCQFRATLIGEY